MFFGQLSQYVHAAELEAYGKSLFTLILLLCAIRLNLLFILILIIKLLLLSIEYWQQIQKLYKILIQLNYIMIGEQSL